MRPKITVNAPSPEWAAAFKQGFEDPYGPLSEGEQEILVYQVTRAEKGAAPVLVPAAPINIGEISYKRGASGNPHSDT
jgi:hypothetical protein